MTLDLTYTISAIQAPLSIPPVNPKDKSLLRPLSELGKPKYAAGGHSFLRRTEYIATGDSRSRDAIINRSAGKLPTKKRKQIDTSKDDPVNILRATVKGFDIAYPEDAYTGPDGENNKIRGSEPTPAETEAWRRPKHPTNPELKVLDSYPLVPDFSAMPDTGAFQVVKFTSHPTQITEVHDARVDVGLLTFVELSPQAQAIVTEDYNAKVAAHQADSTRNPMPGPMFSYRFFVPQDEDGTRAIKRKLIADELDDEDPENPSDQVRFDHLRIYDTSRSVMNTDYLYKEVALALHEPGTEKSNSARKEKSAYYYPLGAKMQLKPRRNKNLAQLGLAARANEEEEEVIDGVYVRIIEPDDALKEHRERHVKELDPAHENL